MSTSDLEVLDEIDFGDINIPPPSIDLSVYSPLTPIQSSVNLGSDGDNVSIKSPSTSDFLQHPESSLSGGIHHPPAPLDALADIIDNGSIDIPSLQSGSPKNGSPSMSASNQMSSFDALSDIDLDIAGISDLSYNQSKEE